MPDDLIDLNTPQSDDEKPEVADEVTSWWIGRWAHVIALVVFAFLYFPLSDHVWTWLVAATVSYIVFMLCCTCGLSFQDSDDFFGNPEVIGYMAILLLRQTFVFALICLFAYLWRYLTPILPAWATAPPSHGLSPWQLGAVLVAYFVAVRESKWMARKIKKRFPDLHEPLDAIEAEESS